MGGANSAAAKIKNENILDSLYQLCICYLDAENIFAPPIELLLETIDQVWQNFQDFVYEDLVK
jgi:hypothetical protein